MVVVNFERSCLLSGKTAIDTVQEDVILTDALTTECSA